MEAYKVYLEQQSSEKEMVPVVVVVVAAATLGVELLELISCIKLLR